MTTEIASLSTAWKRRATLNAVAVCSFAVAAVLAGVALMLSALPPATAGDKATSLFCKFPESGFGLFLGPALVVLLKVVAEHSHSGLRLAKLKQG